MKLDLNEKEKKLLEDAVNNYGDEGDFREHWASDDMELLRAKVLVAVKEKEIDKPNSSSLCGLCKHLASDGICYELSNLASCACRPTPRQSCDFFKKKKEKP